VFECETSHEPSRALTVTALVDLVQDSHRQHLREKIPFQPRDLVAVVPTSIFTLRLASDIYYTFGRLLCVVVRQEFAILAGRGLVQLPIGHEDLDVFHVGLARVKAPVSADGPRQRVVDEAVGGVTGAVQHVLYLRLHRRVANLCVCVCVWHALPAAAPDAEHQCPRLPAPSPRLHPLSPHPVPAS